MKARGLLLLLGVLAALSPLSCSCLSTQRVRAKVEELRVENRARAEPAMLSAAKSRGAVLLPLEPNDIDHRIACVNESVELPSIGGEPPRDICLWMQINRPGCQEWAGDGRTFLIHDASGKSQLVIPIQQVEGSSYARLARRGNKLFVLLPQLTTREEVGTVTECQCDGMPRVHCPSSFGFVLDDGPSSPKIEVVAVPIAERHLRRVCKSVAL